MSTYSNRLQPVLQNLLQRVVRFFHPRSSCTTHISVDDIYITISGGRTEQLDIFCRITGFTSDFPSFIVVELIRIFHGAIQLETYQVSKWVGFIIQITTLQIILETSLSIHSLALTLTHQKNQATEHKK